MFHQDIARVHTSVQSMAEIHQCGFEFPKWKKCLGGKHFFTNEEVIAAVDAYFEELDKDFFKTGIEALPSRLKKCFELGGEYVKK